MQINLAIISYHDSELNILSNDSKTVKLPNLKIKTSNNESIFNLINAWFIDTYQISNLKQQQILNQLVNPLELLTKNQVTILIVTTESQASQIDKYKNTNWLIYRPNEAANTIKNLYQVLNQNIKLNQLSLIHWFLPKKFNSKSIADLISIITNTSTKRNNMARQFQNQLTFLEYDRSHTGHPVKIFQYHD